MRLGYLTEEDAYGLESYNKIKAKRYTLRTSKKNKQERVKRERGQLQRAQQKFNDNGVISHKQYPINKKGT